MEDAYRFVLENQYIVNLAPLQLYSSATVFAPENSPVRKLCGSLPRWLKAFSLGQKGWGPKLLQGCPHCTCLALSSDSSLLAAGNEDGDVQLWDPKTCLSKQVFSSHSGRIEDLKFSADGMLLASLSSKNIMIWNIATGAIIRTHDIADYANARFERLILGFSEDAVYLTTWHDKDTMSMIKLSNASHQQLRSWRKAQHVYHVPMAVSKSDSLFAFYNGQLILYDYLSDKEMVLAESKELVPYALGVSKRYLCYIAQSRCSVVLKIRDLQLNTSRELFGGTFGHSLIYVESGSLISAGPEEISVRDLTSLKIVGIAKCNLMLFPVLANASDTIASYTALGDAIALWKLTFPELGLRRELPAIDMKWALDRPREIPSAIRFSYGGKYLVCVQMTSHDWLNETSVIKVYDTALGFAKAISNKRERLSHKYMHPVVAFSEDDTCFAVISRSPKIQGYVYTVSDGRRIATFENGVVAAEEKVYGLELETIHLIGRFLESLTQLIGESLDWLDSLFISRNWSLVGIDSPNKPLLIYAMPSGRSLLEHSERFAAAPITSFTTEGDLQRRNGDILIFDDPSAETNDPERTTNDLLLGRNSETQIPTTGEMSLRARSGEFLSYHRNWLKYAGQDILWLPNDMRPFSIDLLGGPRWAFSGRKAAGITSDGKIFLLEIQPSEEWEDQWGKLAEAGDDEDDKKKN